MLPVDDVLPKLKSVLERGTSAVLVAPPGAGKTTRVPLALLDAPWRGDRRILMLEPRRLAARAAARRMAEMLGEEVGQTVGYRVRLEKKVSARTRIEIVTEGVFTRMILDDPSLDGVAAVIFDEFHERSLDGDLGLALALDAQGALRDDLRILVMSATIDGARVARLLGEAPVVESLGRMFSIETRHGGRDPARRMEDDVADAVRRSLAADSGSLLVFLPGQAEIRRVAERLEGRVGPEVEIAPLYGALDFAVQDRAIRPAAPGKRKVVLATSIAETSLTIEGVRVVIDSGLARAPIYEPATGLTRLDALDADRRLTQEGAALARLPLSPRLGHMLRKGAALGLGGLAGAVAAVLSEIGLGGNDTDLRERVRRLFAARDPRSRDSLGLAARWARDVGARPDDGRQAPEEAGLLTAFAFPDRIAMARGAPGAFVMANGRGGVLDASDALSREPYLAIASLQGAAEKARILTAAPITLAEIEAHFSGVITDEESVAFDPQTGSVRGRAVRRLGRLVLGDRAIAKVSDGAVQAALLAEIRRRGVAELPWEKSAEQFRARIAFLHARLGGDWPDVSDAALAETLPDWLGPFLNGKRRLDAVTPGLLHEGLASLVPWDKRALMDRLAPTHFDAPSGSRVPIDYSNENGPVLEIRVQELFGLDRHPAVADGAVPVTVTLLSPGHRPIQITRDLPGFWRGSWKDVRSDMRGRYPKHVWPDDPLAAQATARAKPRGT
jgi:ATP-dependent helicase HrpB